MHPTRTLLLAACLLSSTAAHRIAAQSSTATYHIAAGLSLAAGSFGDRNEAGYHIAGGVGMTPRASPISFGIEAFYDEFNQKPTGGSSHAGGITFDGIYQLLAATATRPIGLYGIGGAGYYSTREPFLAHEAQNSFGWNLGGGARYPIGGFSVYVEARYHSVSDANVSFVPIAFGLMFNNP